MLDSDKYREFLKAKIPSARDASGKKQILCRCFYCPDSSNQSSAHFYISIPNEKEPSLFYCQKCHTKGVVTQSTLIKWHIFEPDMALDIINHNKIALKGDNARKYLGREVYNVYNDAITIDNKTQEKLAYINNRLRLNLTYRDLLDMKIVLNLNDVIQRNKLEDTRYPNIMNALDEHFLGFLSLDNAFINMRKIDDVPVPNTIDKRYINYSLFNKYDNTERFYTIPKNINLNQSRRLQLHIAEGPFDILSIYYNLREQSDDIYTCVGGSNYKGIIRYFVTTLRLPYLELHLYPDNDKYGTDSVMMDIQRYISGLQIPLFIHRNVASGEKDFGVSPDRIQETIKRM